jgi:hypothetical protein
MTREESHESGKSPVCVAGVGALSAGSTAQASEEILTFRQSPGGGIEAVVSGLDDGPGCAPEFVAPSSVVVEGTAITITSSNNEVLCTLPQTPVPYEVVADLGLLTGDRYDVTWEQNSMVLTAVLVPSAVVGGPAAPVPMLSLPGILALLLSVITLAVVFGANLARSRSQRIAP